MTGFLVLNTRLPLAALTVTTKKIDFYTSWECRFSLEYPRRPRFALLFQLFTWNPTKSAHTSTSTQVEHPWSHHNPPSTSSPICLRISITLVDGFPEPLHRSHKVLCNTIALRVHQAQVAQRIRSPWFAAFVDHSTARTYSSETSQLCEYIAPKLPWALAFPCRLLIQDLMFFMFPWKVGGKVDHENAPRFT